MGITAVANSIKHPAGQKKEATFQVSGIVIVVFPAASNSDLIIDTGRIISSGIALLSSVENGYS
jgi:hypothetical protein